MLKTVEDSNDEDYMKILVKVKLSYYLIWKTSYFSNKQFLISIFSNKNSPA